MLLVVLLFPRNRLRVQFERKHILTDSNEIYLYSRSLAAAVRRGRFKIIWVKLRNGTLPPLPPPPSSLSAQRPSSKPSRFCSLFAVPCLLLPLASQSIFVAMPSWILGFLVVFFPSPGLHVTFAHPSPGLAKLTSFWPCFHHSAGKTYDLCSGLLGSARFFAPRQVVNYLKN